MRFTTAPAAVFFGDSVVFVAEAFDSNNAVISNTPILYLTSDSTKAAVPNPAVGKVIARTARGSVQITAQLLTPPSASKPLLVQPLPSAIVVNGGNNQTGAVGAALPQTIVARVNAADNLGVQGVKVTFAVTAGGGTLTKLVDTTDANGDARTAWTLGTAPGAQSLTAAAAGLPPATTATFGATAQPGPAKKLVFQVQPSNAAALVAIAPAVKVAAQDSFGNATPGFTGNVTIALGTNPGSATLSGTLTVAAVAGVASFANLSLNNPGTGYTLVASATALAGATSAPFTISGGVPTQLVIVTQPTNVTAGASIGPAVTVEVRDANNTIVSNATNPVTVAIATNLGGATLSGTLTVNAVGGVATFSNLSLDKTASGYTLGFSAPGLTGATSAAFAVGGGQPQILNFTTPPPASTVAGAAFTVVVTAKDQFGNVATGFTGTVTLGFATNPGSGNLLGTITVAAVGGVATFTTPAVDRAASGYTLSASATGVSAGTSSAFAILPSLAATIAFQTPPVTTEAGLVIAPSVQVAVRDTFGNVVTSYVDTVTLNLLANPSGDTLHGTVKVVTSAGVATFTTIRLRKAAAGYTIQANAPGLAAATSPAFTINAGPAFALAFSTQPPASTTAGAALPVAATATDSLGNLAAGFTGAVTLGLGTNPTGDTLQGTVAVNAVAGVATFSAAFLRRAGGAPYTLTAAAASVAAGTSSGVTIGPAAATNLAFTTQPPPSNIYQAPFTAAVTARDAFGNVATSFAGSVTAGIGANPASGTLFGALTQGAVNGVASFSGLNIDNVGAGYTLTAAATGVSSGTSSALNIIAPANVNAWINTAGGNWSVASNWSKGTVPLATDTVAIKQSGTYTVAVDVAVTIARLDVGAPLGLQTVALAGPTLTLNGNAAFSTHGKFALSGGAVTGAGALDVLGSFDWSGGSFSGGSGITRVDPGGTWTVGGTAARQLQAYTVELGGTGVWSGTHVIASGSTGTLRVPSGASMDIQGDVQLLYNLGGANSIFDVQGLVNRTTSTGSVVINAQANVAGTLTVQSGMVLLTGGGTSTGAYLTGASGTLEFGGGTHGLAAAASVGGAGTVSFSGGTANLAGGYAVTGPTLVSGGTANFNGASGAAGALTVSGGTLGGTGLVTVSGAMSWTGGSLSGSGGTTRVLASGTLSLAPAATVNFQSYTLEVAGTGTWTGTATIQSGSGAVLRVASGGTLAIQGDPTLNNNLGGPLSAVNVVGTLSRTTSVNVATLAVPVNDSGLVDVQSGTLRLANGGTSSGAYAAASGATLDFTGGTHGLAAAASVGGAGTVSFSGGTANLAGGYAVTGPTLVSGGAANFNGASGATGALTVSGGTLGGTGLVTVSGAMSWTGGSLAGGGGTTRVLSSGTVSLAPAATVNFQSYTLEVAGTGTWTGTATIQGGSGAVLRILSTGLLDVQGDISINNNLGGALSHVVVYGTLQRSTSLNPATFSTAVDDSGSVNVGSGTLRLNGGGASSGAYLAVGGATLEFGGGTHTLAGSTIISGAGTALVSGGTVNDAGGVAVTGTTRFTAGTFNYTGASGATSAFDLAGGTFGGSTLFTVSGPLTWTTGAFVGTGGTTRVLAGGSMSISGVNARSMQNYILENASAAATWSGTHTISTGSGAVLRNLASGTLAVTADPTFAFALGGAASTFDNQGTLIRSTSAGVFTLSAQWTNSGPVNISSGSILVNSGGTFGGAFTANGGALNLGGGTITMTNTWGVAGPNAVTLQGATLAGLAAGDTVSINNLVLSSGTLSPNALSAVRIPATGLGNWSGGATLSGGGGLVVNSGASFQFTGTATRTLQNATFENRGSTTWSGAAQINSGSVAVIRNTATGTFAVNAAATYAFNLGGTASLFDNLGALTVNPGAGLAFTVSAVFNNTVGGTMLVSSGTLNLTGGGTQAAAGTIAAGALLDFNGGTHTLNNGANYTAATGFVRVVSGSVTGATALDTARFANLELVSGTVSHPGGMVANTQLLWSGNTTLSGTGTTRALSLLNLTGTLTRTLQNGVLENRGVGSSWSGSFQINSGSGATFLNAAGATLTVTGTAASMLFNLGGAPTAFSNQGTLTVNPGAANSFTVSATFNNPATVAVTAGTLNLTGGGTQTSSVALNAANAFLDFNGGTHTLNNGFSQTGTGTAHLVSGVLTTTTALDTARFVNLQLLGGTLGQPGGVVVSTLLDWNGNTTIAGTGTTAASTSLTLTGTLTRTLQNGLLENRGTATWSGTFQINSGNGAVIRNGAGKSFSLTGNGSFLANLGGAPVVFDNRGTFTNSGAGTAVISAQYIDTVGTTTISAGTLQLSGGARLSSGTGKSIASGAVLEQTAGTVTFKQATSITGAGRYVGTAGTMTPDSNTATAPTTNALSFTNLDLNGASLAHEGLVQISGVFNWNAGTITSNTSQLGGTTRILSGATMTIPNTTTLTLSGVHTLDVTAGGTLNYTGSQDINTGLGAIIQNAGNFNLQGTGQIRWNLGGTQTEFRLIGGALTRNTSAATAILEPAMNWSAGTVTVSTGILQLAGGSVTNFAGSATVTPANGLQLTGGAFTPNFTLSNNLTVTGDLVVSGNTLVLNGHKAVTSNNFSATAFGGVSMTNALDTLAINGNASFAGGAFPMSKGGIRVAGNFSDTSSFAPSGTHTTLLNGTAAQSVSFTNAPTNFFRRLEVNKSAGGVVLGSNVKASFLRWVSGATLTGAFRLLTDTLLSPQVAGHTFTPLVIEVAGLYRDSGAGGWQPDTTVFTGASQSIDLSNTTFGSYAYKSIRVAQSSGTASFSSPISLPNDLVVSAGTLNLNAFHIGVTGNFRTENTGVLQMASANDSLGVGGSATFSGGSTTGLLTSGIITVKGNFAQSGNAASYAPSGTTHRTRFDLAGSAVAQNINFANPTTSFFDSLDLNRGPSTRGTVNFQTDARMTRGLSIQNSTDVTGPTARLSITGGSLTASQSTTSPTMLTTRALELAVTPPALANMVGAVNISPDTVVINTGITTLPVASGLRYNSIRVNTGANLTMSIDTIANDLHVATGTAVFSGATTFQMNGKLRTTGTGALSMTNAVANVTVADSAIFSGASTNGLLTAGTLRAKGNFTQNTNATAFVATANHTTEFNGTPGLGTQTVAFSNPDSLNTGSHFSNLLISNSDSGGVTIASDVFADSSLSTPFGPPFRRIYSPAAKRIIARGANVDSLILDNTQLVLTGPNGLIYNNSRFRNFASTLTQLTVVRQTGSATLNFLVFPITNPSPGFYVATQLVGAGSFGLTLNGTTPVAGSNGGRISQAAGTTITWQ